jgi:hypothetical protein
VLPSIVVKKWVCGCLSWVVGLLWVMGFWFLFGLAVEQAARGVGLASSWLGLAPYLPWVAHGQTGCWGLYHCIGSGGGMSYGGNEINQL